VNLSEGQVVSLLVGQQPTPLTANVADNVTVGGGGGTFVTSGGKPLIVASGGDGGSTSNLFELSDFSTNSRLSSMSGDGNTIVGVIINTSTLYIYNKVNNLWILNNQTINIPTGTGEGVSLIILNYDGTRFILMYGCFDYPNYSSTNMVYSYSSLTNRWDDGTILLVNSNYPKSYADISGDGNVIGMTYPNYGTYIFRYSNGSWPYDLIPSSSIGYVLSLSIDGNTLVSATEEGQQVSVFTYTNGSWDSGVNLGIEYPNNTIYASISGDKQTVIAQYGYSNLCILYKYINGSWDSGTQLSIGNLNYNGAPVDINYDGSIAFYIWSTEQIAIYNSGVVTKINNTGNYTSMISCTLDGNQFIVSYGSGNTSLFVKKISHTGSFSPFGNGSGFSGAGYLTDGEVTNPFFQFLKPNAYVNGGFGNSYLYGIKTKEGGFGGGQCPIGLVTTLTSLIGYANSYPEISVQTISSIALDSSGTTVIIGQQNSSKATVYKYSNGAWDEGYDFYTWYTAGKSVALSADGNTAVVSSLQGFAIFIYSGGGWYQQYYVEGGFGNYFGYSVALNSSGTILFVGAPYTYGGPAYVSVYRFSGSVWYWSENLPINIPGYPNLEGFGYSLSSSVDGNKVIVGMSSFYALTTSSSNVYIFTYSNDSWGSGISLSDDLAFDTSVALSDDGTTALVGSPVGKYATLFKYIDGVWTSVQTFSDNVLDFGISVALTDNGTTQIIGSAYLVKIYKSGQTYISYGACSALAVSDNILAFPLTNTLLTFENLNDPATTCTAVTSIPHGYPREYQVQITGTNSFNGTWDITTTSPTTFTFQAFGGPTETSGYVSGIVTGISGGGGYTGSPGDGVSGATCYADASVTNFTDLGATSNSAGYVTVSLIDPPPVQRVWNWEDRANWLLEGVQLKNCKQIAWSPQLGEFIGINTTVLPVVQTSPDGIKWSTVDSNLPLINFAHAFITTNQGIVLSSESGLWSTRDATTWTNTSSTTRDPGVFVDALSNIYFYSLANVYISSDAYTWSRYPTPQIDYVSYGNNEFRGLTNDALTYNSSDGITWEQSTNQTGVTSSVSAFTYTNDTFIAAGEAPRTLPTEFFLLSSSTINISNDGYTWTNTGVAAASGAIASGNNVYVAAITNGFLRSEDTITWTEVYSPISCQYIIYGNNVFVGIGEGSIVTSSDGNTWTLRNLPEGGTWVTLTYGNGVFYVYDYYSSTVTTSTNGVDWTPPQTGSNLPVSDVPIFAYGNNIFVSVNRYSGAVKSSNDGYTWTNITLSTYVSSVAFGNGIFVLVGSTFYTSTNGATWTDLGEIGNSGINGVAYINGVFSATGYDNGLTSPDGIHWTEHTNNWGFFYQTKMIGTSGNLISNVEIISYSSTGNTWSNVDIYDSLTQISSLNGVVIGTNSTNVWYSSDLSQWTKNPVTFSLQNTIAPVPELGYCILTDSKYSYLTIDGRFVVHPVDNSGGFNQTTWSSQLGLFIGTGEGIVSVSSDGKSWTSISVPLITGVSAIEWSPELGIFVVYCYGSSFVSKDGYNWTRYSAPSVTLSSGYKALVWAESLGIFTLGGVMTSKDGINWTTPTGGLVISPIAWSPSLSLFSSGKYYSRDGITWSTSDIPISSLSIVWSSALKLFLCVDIDGKYVTSSDGINWTSPSSKNIADQILPNLFVGTDFQYDPNDAISASSTNGIVWTSSSLPPYGDYLPRPISIIYGRGIYTIYTVDYVSYTSSDGVNWSVIPNEDNLTIFSVSYGNGLYVACDGYYSSILISDDGLNFTRIDMKLPGTSVSVVYGRGIFVVGLANYSSAPSIATSFDGINWTLRDVPPLEYRYVMYGGGLFIGVSYSGYGVITSSDGINWTQHTCPNSYWSTGAYGNGIYVFCSSYVTYQGSIPFMTSPDGITWTARYSSILPDRDWVTISFGSGLFVVSDGVNTTITSPDGINWTLRDAPGLSSITHAPPQFTSIVSSWSDELQTFLVLATQDTKTYVFTSTDGVSFTSEGYFEGSRSFLKSLTWSPTRNFLLTNGESFYLSQPATSNF
jgi:hypothetical protein